MELETIYEDETSRQAYVGPLHIAAWFDAPTLSQMRVYGRHAVALAARHERTALMTLIVKGRPSFDPAVRDEVKRLTSRGIHRAGTAHVVLATGLVGAAARAFMSTSVLVGRPNTPTKVFGDLDEAGIWLGQRLDVAPAPLVDAARAMIAGLR